MQAAQSGIFIIISGVLRMYALLKRRFPIYKPSKSVYNKAS